MPTDSIARLDRLFATAAVLVVAAASLAGVGMRQKRHRGFGFWVAGLALAALGAGLCAAGQNTWVQLPGTLLLMQWTMLMLVRCPMLMVVQWPTLMLVQWPMLMLVRMRRLKARRNIPGHEQADRWLLGAAGLTSVMVCMSPATPDQVVWTAAICSVVLHI